MIAARIKTSENLEPERIADLLVVLGSGAVSASFTPYDEPVPARSTCPSAVSSPPDQQSTELGGLHVAGVPADRDSVSAPVEVAGSRELHPIGPRPFVRSGHNGVG